MAIEAASSSALQVSRAEDNHYTDSDDIHWTPDATIIEAGHGQFRDMLSHTTTENDVIT